MPSRDSTIRAAITATRDFSNKEDVGQVHTLQDAIKFSQGHPGTFEIPNWDKASLKKIQAALLQLGTTVSDTRRMFGANENEVDPVRHLIGSAMLWGGYPEKEALYLPITPPGMTAPPSTNSRSEAATPRRHRQSPTQLHPGAANPTPDMLTRGRGPLSDPAQAQPQARHGVQVSSGSP